MENDFKLIAVRTVRNYRTYQIRVVEGEHEHEYKSGFEIWKGEERRLLNMLYPASTPTTTLLQIAYQHVNQFRREEIKYEFCH